MSTRPQRTQLNEQSFIVCSAVGIANCITGGDGKGVEMWQCRALTTRIGLVLEKKKSPSFLGPEFPLWGPASSDAKSNAWEILKFPNANMSKKLKCGCAAGTKLRECGNGKGRQWRWRYGSSLTTRKEFSIGQSSSFRVRVLLAVSTNAHAASRCWKIFKFPNVNTAFL